MKRKPVEEVIQEFEKAGETTYNATLKGDHKTNNKVGRQLKSLYMDFEKDREYGYQCIDKLIESPSVIVRTDAAAYCLALSYRIDDAISVLEEIAEDPENGIFGFNAKMTLKVWREQGYLKIYQ